MLDSHPNHSTVDAPAAESSATRSTFSSPAPRLIDVKCASDLYGVNWRTFLRWADGGLVPWGVKIGGRRLWRNDELDQHIRDGCRPVRKAVRR
jgi:hypothetical protein